MLELNRILVATDFEKAADNAYSHAQKLAEHLGGKVDLLHVIPTLKYFHESMKTVGYPLSMEDDVYPKLLEKSKETLQSVMQEHIGQEHRGGSHVKIGPRASEIILDCAHETGADIIIMGAHNNDPVEMILGTTTERVIRKSDIPVFSVPPDVGVETYNNIVVPTDLSELSLHGLLDATRFASALDAGITVLHVLELHGYSAEDELPEEPESATNDMREKMFRKIQKYLQKQDNSARIESHSKGYQIVFQENGTEKSIPVSLEVTRGVSAHYEIVDFANKRADMVVITTHGRSGFAHFLLGSTTEQVIRWCRTPVLTSRNIKQQH